jgi:hypothetical protein
MDSGQGQIKVSIVIDLYLRANIRPSSTSETANVNNACAGMEMVSRLQNGQIFFFVDG